MWLFSTSGRGCFGPAFTVRHSGLTFAASTGATTAELMRRAGHASPNAAMRYQHATLERDRALTRDLMSFRVTDSRRLDAECMFPGSSTGARESLTPFNREAKRASAPRDAARVLKRGRSSFDRN